MRGAPVIRRRRNDRGYVLLTVLWIGLGLLLAASTFLTDQRQEAMSARAEIEASRAVELARSGLNIALADLGRLEQQGPKTRRDGTPQTISMAEGTVTYRIFDEAGKIDVNQAPIELIRPAMMGVGSVAGFDAFDASNIAEAIIANRGGGPETLFDTLTTAGLSNSAAQIALRTFSAHNFSNTVNPETAPRTVLNVIPGLGPSDVEEIIQRRETGQGLPRLGTASVWLVAAEGPAYTVEAEAKLATGATATMTALVANQGLTFRGGRAAFKTLSVRIER